MNLFSFNNLTKSRSGRLLFNDISLGMNSGDKIALIGTNGTGKTTLLNMLCGRLEPDSGTIHFNRETRISYLDQQAVFTSDDTVFDFLLKDDNPVFALLRDYHHCVHGSGEAEDKGCTHVLERMDLENGWGLESKIRTMLYEMGINDGEVLMSSLSGGMRRRAALTRALLGDSNLLILDEPTNHLDIPTILRLQKILQKTDQAILLVTHDRYLADEVCGKIWELDDQKIYSHEGGYSAFLERRAERLEEQKNRQLKISNILRTELEWLARGPRARATKDKKRKERIYNLMDEKKIDTSRDLSFSTNEGRTIKRILELEKVDVSFQDKTILKNFSFEFLPGQKIGILGPNGAGKTTMLNLIAEEIENAGGTVAGVIDRGVNTRVGYFRQLTPKMKDLGVIEFLKETAPMLTLADGRNYTPTQLLEWFQFPKSLHYQPISTLSGGERRRLFLVDVLLHNPNFLMLDEPTNDLDLQTLSALENFLTGFSGCLLVVSHDRSFLDRTVDSLLVLDGEGGVSGFPGSCTDYLEYVEDIRKREQKSDSLKEGKTKPEKNNYRKKDDNGPKKLSFNEKKELSSIEDEIASLEDEQAELENSFSAANPDPELLKKNTVRFTEVGELLEAKYARWEELSAREHI
ncbi:MAG: ABC-F family ATP-binding cassette domain-containing protein [Spirochaetales bacterium]|nr:ABC-F family ATP-binding cassette domain-containing protein [Spirochaetales bacterium]